MINILGNSKHKEVSQILIENLSRPSILLNLVCWCLDQRSFQAELLTLFGDKDIDFHHETTKECNSVFQIYNPLLALNFFLHKYL